MLYLRKSRLVSKSGRTNVHLLNLPRKYFRFTKDLANTLVSLRWRWVTLIVILVHFAFFLLFSAIWLLDAYLSGDDLSNPQAPNNCISLAGHYVNYLLLAIETLTTTGYGYVHPNENCRLVFLTLTLNTLIMILLDGAFISVVFLKVFKPHKMDARQIFSRKAVINVRNGRLCLIIKIMDAMKKHAIAPKVTLHLIRHTSIETMQELKVEPFGLLAGWPIDIVHVINRKSPLWQMNASDLIASKFELVACLDGTSLITSQFSRTATSYLNSEILWGYRFVPNLKFDEAFRMYIIRDLFEVIGCETPLCSARDLKRIEANYRREINS